MGIPAYLLAMEQEQRSRTFNLPRLLIKWLATSVAVYFADWLFTGIRLDGFGTALIVALVLGLLNAFIKPILQLLSVPLIVLTLGLFLLVINAVILLFASELIGTAFRVDGFWPALWGSIVISLVTYLIDPPRNGRGTQVTIRRGE